MKVVGLDNAVRNEVIAVAKKILDTCEKREAHTITCVIEFTDGTYLTTGSKAKSRLESAGLLLEMAIDRLQIGVVVKEPA